MTCTECGHPAAIHDQWGCATTVKDDDGRRVWCNCSKRREYFITLTGEKK